MIVATIRALKMHGGVAKDDLKKENVAALEKGFANLEAPYRQCPQIRRAGASSRSTASRPTPRPRWRLLEKLCKAGKASNASLADHWALRRRRRGRSRQDGGPHHRDEAVRTSSRSIPTTCRCARRCAPSPRRSTAPPTSPPTRACSDRFAELEKEGFGNFPVCIAKTQYSFSTDPNAKGAPSGFTIPIREVRLSAGAEFVVVVCGDIMTMPGLPKVPAANNIELDTDGRITGLF